ncbi:DUF1289 domain-containing protein [Accumulibacter sp.]|uniref:DUF1289 domain-containing protein n=1 Tax=Accumulibacter sp. TaxID=2053492 RepID=UPI0028C48F13|nr:DUF1289 domain-containing protein [Accumulibacter sp.]
MTTRVATQRIVSPCVNICKMDGVGGFCLGCFRTLDEIAVWSRAFDEQRLQILLAVERRRLEHDPAGCASGGEFRGDCER